MFNAWISLRYNNKNYTIKTIPLHTCSACTLSELPVHNTQILNEALDKETQIIPPSQHFHVDKLHAN